MRKAAKPVTLALLAIALAASSAASAALPEGNQAQEGASAAAHRSPAPPAARSAHDEYEVERALGAKCPEPGHGFSPWRSNHIEYPCYGRVPEHLSRFFLAIPADDLPLTQEQRLAFVRAAHPFKAVAGLGARPDFMVDAGSIWIRSLEGADPDAAVYLVHGPLCRDQRNDALDCEYPSGLRAYRFNGTTAVDVTSRVLPAAPTLTPDEARRYGPHIASSLTEASASDIHLDFDKLQYAPVMRWFMEFDPATPIPESDPRLYSAWALAHFGFAVWNGQRFELRQHVIRSLWPCRPVAQDSPACSYYPDAGADPFIIQ